MALVSLRWPAPESRASNSLIWLTERISSIRKAALALLGQADLQPTAIAGRPLPGDELAAFEPGRDPAEIAGVDVEHAAQFGGVQVIPAGQLEDHPRLGRRVRVASRPLLAARLHGHRHRLPRWPARQVRCAGSLPGSCEILDGGTGA